MFPHRLLRLFGLLCLLAAVAATGAVPAALAPPATTSPRIAYSTAGEPVAWGDSLLSQCQVRLVDYYTNCLGALNELSDELEVATSAAQAPAADAPTLAAATHALVARSIASLKKDPKKAPPRQCCHAAAKLMQSKWLQRCACEPDVARYTAGIDRTFLDAGTAYLSDACGLAGHAPEPWPTCNNASSLAAAVAGGGGRKLQGTCAREYGCKLDYVCRQWAHICEIGYGSCNGLGDAIWGTAKTTTCYLGTTFCNAYGCSEHTATSYRCCKMDTQAACFPADARVRLLDGSDKSMAELRVGDSVQVLDAAGRTTYQPVYLMGHELHGATSRFVRIDTDAGAALELSPDHFLPVVRGSAGGAGARLGAWAAARMARARDVTAGDTVFVAGRDGGRAPARVVSMSMRTKRGLFNPYTFGGSIVVNGVLASSHSRFVLDGVFDALGLPPHLLPAVYEALFAPMRALYLAAGPAAAARVGRVLAPVANGELELEHGAARASLAACAVGVLAVARALVKRGKLA